MKGEDRTTAAGQPDDGLRRSRLVRFVEFWSGLPPWVRLLGELVPGALIAGALFFVPSRPDDAWVDPVASCLVFAAFAVQPLRRFRRALQSRRRAGGGESTGSN